MTKLTLFTLILATFLAFNLAKGDDECDIQVIRSGEELECGESNARAGVSQRLIGGTDAWPGQFPWTASIQFNKYKDSFQCGGSLIDHQHIITAAHCFDSLDPRVYSVNLGAYKRKVAGHDCRTELEVESIHIHELYNETKKEVQAAYDIALLKLRNPVEFMLTAEGYGSINRICLPEQNKEYEVGTEITLSGWGHLGQRYFKDKSGACERKTDSEARPSSMQTSTFKIIPNEDCISKLRPIHICLNSNLMHTPAAGDSGSPYVEFIDDQAFQVGIVSGQDGDPEVEDCQRITAHAVKVSKFIDWIDQHVLLSNQVHV